MSHSYIVEYRDEPIGLVKRDPEDGPFVFFASDRRVDALEGRSFPSPRDAEAAARRMIGKPGAQGQTRPGPTGRRSG